MKTNKQVYKKPHTQTNKNIKLWTIISEKGSKQLTELN